MTIVPGEGDAGAGDPDQLTFTFQPASADLDISACVGLKLMFDPYATAGLMIRDSLGPDARSASLLYTPARAVAFQTRSSAEPTAQYTAAAIPAPCLRLVRRGDVVTAYQLTMTGAWLWVGEQAVPMSGALYAGVALSGEWTASTLFSDVTLATLQGDGVLSSNLWASAGSVQPAANPPPAEPAATSPAAAESAGRSAPSRSAANNTAPGSADPRRSGSRSDRVPVRHGI